MSTFLSGVEILEIQTFVRPLENEDDIAQWLDLFHVFSRVEQLRILGNLIRALPARCNSSPPKWPPTCCPHCANSPSAWTRLSCGRSSRSLARITARVFPPLYCTLVIGGRVNLADFARTPPSYLLPSTISRHQPAKRCITKTCPESSSP